MDAMDEGKDGFIMVLKIMNLVMMMMMMMMMMTHELANNPILTLDQVLCVRRTEATKLVQHDSTCVEHLSRMFSLDWETFMFDNG